MNWSAEQYSKFEKERNRPATDLLARVTTRNIRTAADIGCGPGNSTEILTQLFPDAVIVGVDNSINMIEAARKRLPGLHFEVDDISAWKNEGPFDLILANAALQWVPDHDMLFPALLSKLAPGGSLAVQMPDNFDEPTHRLMRETAADGPWAAKLTAAPLRIARQTAGWYYNTLHNKTSSMDIWRTTYYHQLSGGPSAVVEWVKGTGLRPYLDPLDEQERTAFLAKYQAAINIAYPAYQDGTVLLPFPRLFIVATINA